MIKCFKDKKKSKRRTKNFSLVGKLVPQSGIVVSRRGIDSIGRRKISRVSKSIPKHLR